MPYIAQEPCPCREVSNVIEYQPSKSSSSWTSNAHWYNLARLRERDVTGGGLGYPKVMELIFEIRDAEEGGFCARALGHDIFTEADTWEELRVNVLEAVSPHFEDAQVRPRLVQTHYLKDELLRVEAA